MSKVLAALENLPSFEAMKAEREATGEALCHIRKRRQKEAILRAIAVAENLDDMKIILARLVERYD